MINSNNNIFLALLILLLTTYCFGQKQFEGVVKGTIKNYANKQIYFYRCYGDTLLFSDSLMTNEKGKFIFKYQTDSKNLSGLFKVILKSNQFFYILYNGSPVEIQTVYNPDVFYNIAIDSLKILISEENKQLYEFQSLQQKVNIARGWLLQMMRLYPLTDPFHKKIEDEYSKRYKAMELFVKKQSSRKSGFGRVQNLSHFIANAFFMPVNPDWKDPDPDRNKIIIEHFFDYFNPAENFYLHTNILPEKIEEWFTLHSGNSESLKLNENEMQQASEIFLDKLKNGTDAHSQIFEFTLNYILKKVNKEHFDNALLYLYDLYVKTEAGDCNPSNTTFNWIREKTNTLRNIQMGSVVPDFDIDKGTLRMSSLKSNYTLLIFWASWCSHCVLVLPEIKKAVEMYNKEQEIKKQITVVAVSLDNKMEEWQEFINKGNYSSWLNTSELKGWNGEVPKKYNVYATPTMFLLDKEKKIIGKPEDTAQLLQIIDTNRNLGSIDHD